MEALILNCLQAQLLWNRVNTHPQITPQAKNDLLYEIKLVTPKKCDIDAKAD
jgi:hypothetical protein